MIDYRKIISDIIDEIGPRIFSIKRKTEYKELYRHVCENTKFLEGLGISPIDRTYYYIRQLSEVNRCKECNGVLIALKRSFCSKRCMDSSEILKKQKELTSIERFGATNVYKSEYFKKRSKETMNEKYGTNYYSQSEQFNIKIKETCMKRYGTESHIQSEEIKNTIIRNNLEKTGVKWLLSLPET